MVRGEFLRRLNRFTLAVHVNGKDELAHLPNPGRLLQVLSPGRVLLLRPSPLGRRTRWTAVAADLGTFLVSLDSTLPNRVFPQLLAKGFIPELKGLPITAKEPKLGRGRADFLLVQEGKRVWVEVKSVTVVEEGVALFPDAPTARGARHIRELADRVRAGDRAFLVFVVQRPDAEKFGPNAEVDPQFAAHFVHALSVGVQTRAIVCSFDGFELHPLRVLGPESLVFPLPCPSYSLALP